MHKSGRLTLIKTMLGVILVHMAISIEFLGWVHKALIKIMHAFLWSGTKSVQSGKCAVVWSQVQWPLHMGGLGIPDLRLMAMSLWLRWMWFDHADSARIALHLASRVNATSKAFFCASIIYSAGNGASMLF
jgi:hypothetical protein